MNGSYEELCSTVCSVLVALKDKNKFVELIARSNIHDETLLHDETLQGLQTISRNCGSPI